MSGTISPQLTPHPDHLYLVDGFSLIFRGYFPLARTPLRTKKGEDVTALFGFLNMLVELLHRYQPRYIAVAWESEEPTERHQIFVDYKRDRPPAPEPIQFALPYIREFLRALGIRVLEYPGIEADDVLATVAVHSCETWKQYVWIVTSDKDLEQIVRECIGILRPAGSRSAEGYDVVLPRDVEERWGVPPSRLVDFFALVGDKVDNIPGVEGIGPRSAQQLIRKFGTLEEIYAHLSEIQPEHIRKKLWKDRENAFLSRELIRLRIHPEIVRNLSLEDFRRQEPDIPTLEKWIRRFEFRKLGERIRKLYQGQGRDREPRTLWETGSGKSSISPALFSPDSPAGESVFRSSGKDPTRREEERREEEKNEGEGLLFPVKVREPEWETFAPEKVEYRMILPGESLDPLIEDLRKAEVFSLDVETTAIYPHTAELVGISLSTHPRTGWYIHVLGAPSSWMERLRMALRPIFLSSEKEKVGQNLKYDLVVLDRHGFPVRGPFFDTMIAHILVDPSGKHNLDAMARQYLGYDPIPIERLLGEGRKGNMRLLAPEQIRDYAVEDADITLRLRTPLLLELQKNGMDKLFDEIEMPLLEVLVHMERTGVYVSAEYLREVGVRMDREMQELAKKIYSLTGVSFNLNSPQQLGHVLFERLQLPYPGKKTRTGKYSTSESVLQKLVSQHPVIPLILEYRELQKLKSTYVEGLLRNIHPETGRIHTTYHQIGTATGRLSSSNPNLQNIPVRGERGKWIRAAFQGEKNYLLASLDYSQIELRIIAHLSGDPALIQAFQDGRDIHTETACRLFGCSPDAVSPELRRKAKAVNFGIIYGISAHGLAQQLGISRKEARQMIERYFETYPRVRAFLDQILQEARAKGYVQTLTGRRRFIPELFSANPALRGHGERIAINTPVQGTAADIIKKAMVQVFRFLQQQNAQTRMILQVHDELVFEYPPEEESLLPEIQQQMEQVMNLKVPLRVDVGTGKTWAEAHDGG